MRGHIRPPPPAHPVLPRGTRIHPQHPGERSIDGQLPGGGGGGRGDPAPRRQGGAAVRGGHRGGGDARQPRALRGARRAPRLGRRQAGRGPGGLHGRGGGRRRQDHQGEAAQAQGHAAPGAGVPAHHLARCVY